MPRQTWPATTSQLMKKKKAKIACRTGAESAAAQAACRARKRGTERCLSVVPPACASPARGCAGRTSASARPASRASASSTLVTTCTPCSRPACWTSSCACRSWSTCARTRSSSICQTVGGSRAARARAFAPGRKRPRARAQVPREHADASAPKRLGRRPWSKRVRSVAQTRSLKNRLR